MSNRSPLPIFPISPLKVIEPSKFKEKMEMQVLPSLKKCRSDEWTAIRGKFCRVKGIQDGNPGTGFAHWVFYSAASFDRSMREVSFDLPLGTVVIFVGFTQSEMRFSELAWYFLKYGLNVLIMEHRGHGLSFYLPTPWGELSGRQWKKSFPSFSTVPCFLPPCFFPKCSSLPLSCGRLLNLCAL